MIVNRILKMAAIASCSLALAMPTKADVGFAITSGMIATFDTTGTEREGNSSNTNSATETASTSVSEDVNYGAIFAEVVGEEAYGAGITLE